MTSAAGKTTQRPRRIAWGFIVFMSVLTVLFLGLGYWQLQRLAWKEHLIASVTERAGLPPSVLPPASEWGGLDPDVYDFRPVSVTGAFDYPHTVLVFTSLSEPRGRFSGPGYWVMTPLLPENGGAVWVNRGFIPQNARSAFAAGGPEANGPVTVEGLARQSEATNAFTPGPDMDNRIDWVRNIARLTDLSGLTGTPFAEIYIDSKAGDPGALPQGGETKISFPNRHLEYALTWFSFALITPLLAGYWLWRQRRKA